MKKLDRFGVSIDADLLRSFDRLISDYNYTNRSQAIAELMRQRIIERDWHASKKKVAAIISLVYNHHRRELVSKIMDIQHDFQKLIISTQHIHLDHDHCLEIIAARGKSSEITDLARKLRVIKGVKHAALTATTAGGQLS